MKLVFFKDRYSAFYLFSINTNDGDRVRRLIKKGFSDKQIETLDDQEYPEKKETNNSRLKIYKNV